MKSLPLSLLLSALALLLTSCEKPDRVNPYDEKATLNPNDWAPRNFRIEEKITITEKRLSWTYEDENIEGFKLDRKKDDEPWQKEYQVFNKEIRSWNEIVINPFPEQMYQYRLYAFAGNNNSGYAETMAVFTLKIGGIFGGGILFYVDSIGGGLVCAQTDQGDGIVWGCNETVIGGTELEIGTGPTNTAAIVAGCSESDIAARICNDLVLNGYDDWFLPSKDELNLMYQNLHLAGIGTFAWDYYWSSSEHDSTSAWIHDFWSGPQYRATKNFDSFHFRAVRAFKPFNSLTRHTSKSKIINRKS
jgi:hypothetical protein